MSMVRYDGFNKGTMLGTWRITLNGQHWIYWKTGPFTHYVTLNEANILVNQIIDCMEDARKEGHWPPPEPNR